MSTYLWDQYDEVWLDEAPSIVGRPRGVELEQFRGLMSAFPTGVAVITTIDADGEPRGMTANAVSSISARPPLLMVALDSRSGTLTDIERHGAFAVNILAGSGAEVSNRFARSATARFDGIAWDASDVARGVPILTEHTTAVAECMVDSMVGAGDHVVIFGRIVAGRLNDVAPLVYHQRVYADWAALAESQDTE